jgi:hypothetical protein
MRSPPDSPPAPEPSLAELRSAAEALLFHTVHVVDPATGASTARRVETPLYRQYLDLRAEHAAARATYEAAHHEAQRSPVWPLLAGALRLPVQQAHERWRAAGAEQVEQALAILARVGDTDPQSRDDA